MILIGSVRRTEDQNENAGHLGRGGFLLHKGKEEVKLSEVERVGREAEEVLVDNRDGGEVRGDEVKVLTPSF